MVVDKYVGRCLDVGSTPTGSIIPLHSFAFLGKTLLNQRFFLCDFQSVSLRQVRDKKKHPLCGCASKVIPKKLQTRYNKGVQANCKAKGEKYGTKGSQFIAHKVALFYHIVFTPKCRRKVIYNQYRSSLGEIFHRLCSYKGVEIIEGHLMPDHVHMLVSISPRISASSFMEDLKD